VARAVAVLRMSHEEDAFPERRDGNPQTGREFRIMRATRLSVANYNTTLSSDSLESGTGNSNSLRSANESPRTDSRPNEAKSFCDLSQDRPLRNVFRAAVQPMILRCSHPGCSPPDTLADANNPRGGFRTGGLSSRSPDQGASPYLHP
jgi:hypothetical protein